MIVIGLQKMPYSYYNLLRDVVFFCSIFLIISDLISKQFYLIIFYSIIGILFNPINKMFFKRAEWHLIDLATIILFASALTIDLVLTFKRNPNEK